jgi:hypothetical protein
VSKSAFERALSLVGDEAVLLVKRSAELKESVLPVSGKGWAVAKVETDPGLGVVSGAVPR